jgi:hypothetical protein
VETPASRATSLIPGMSGHLPWCLLWQDDPSADAYFGNWRAHVVKNAFRTLYSCFAPLVR